jgi:hypothetical protein
VGAVVGLDAEPVEAVVAAFGLAAAAATPGMTAGDTGTKDGRDGPKAHPPTEARPARAITRRNWKNSDEVEYR